MTTPCIQAEELKEMKKEAYERGKQAVLQSEQIINMNEKVDKLDKKVDGLDIKMTSGFKDVLEKIEKLEKKFSAKRVEWFVKGLIGLFMTAMGVALLKLIIL